MIWLLALACGDKDTRDDSETVSDSPVGDSDADSGDSDPSDPHCELGPMSPATVPLAGAEVVFHYSCVGTSMASVATSEGDWACEQDGATLVCQTSSFTASGLKDVVLTDTDGLTWPGALRVHGEVELLPPEGLVQVQAEGTVVHLGVEELLVLGTDALRRVRLDGSVDKEFALTSEKLCEGCWTQGSPLGVLGVDGSTVHVVTLESQDAYTLSFDAVLDASLHADGPRAVGSVKSSDRGESVYASDLSTGGIWSLGALEGELRILDDGVVEAACDKTSQLTFTDVMWTSGKQVSSASGPFECFPTTWKVSLMDVDGDGHEDQVHSLTYSTGDRLGVRFGDGAGAFGATQEVGHPEGFEARSFRFDEGVGRVLYDEHGMTSKRWSGALASGEASSVAVDNPVFVGNPGAAENILGQLRPSSGAPGLARTEDALYLLTGTEWPLATNGAGETLLRVKKPGSYFLSFQVAGKEVEGRGDAHAAALYGERSLFFSGEGEDGTVLIDDREYTTGSHEFDDLSFTVTPVGAPLGSQALLAWRDQGELGLTLLDLDDPGDDEGRLRKRPDLLVAEWDELIDEGVEQLQENPLASVAPPTGVSSEVTLPSAVLTVAWETGTDCPWATVLVPGLSEDMSSNWEAAQVLSTSEDAACRDLAWALGSADVYGDGGSVVVLSDGTLLRLLEFQIPEKVVMEKEDDFYGMQSGDFNGDGLADMVLVQADGERVLWLSDGEGGELESETELPDWLSLSRQVGSGPGAGASPVRLFSWGLVLD